MNRSEISKGMDMLFEAINIIPNESIKNFIKECLDVAPEYFWTISSSSTGKHHPEWAKGENGLVKHTIMAMHLGKELSRDYELGEVDTSMAIGALALHDTLKYGIDYDERYGKVHQYLPRIYYKDVISDFNENQVICDNSGHAYIYPDTNMVINRIFGAIERHMGNIKSGSWTSVDRLMPETDVEEVVHLADYIASREFIDSNLFKE